MEHQFNVQVAQRFGVEEAIVIHNLFHWISKNAANEENMYEGLYWTYNSIKAYSALFPYLSETKVKRVFRNLEEKGIIVKGNFSDDKWIRTNWYSFPEDTLAYLQNVGYDVHWVKMTSSIGSKCTNALGQNDQMILINYTDSKLTDSKLKEKEGKPSSKKTPTESFVPPTLQEVEAYVKKKGYHFSARSFVDYYEADDWYYGKGSKRRKVQNWKRCCATWEGMRRESIGGDAEVERQDATLREEMLLRRFYGILGEQEADIYGKDRYSWMMLTEQQKNYWRNMENNRSKLLAWIREHDG